MCGIAGVFSAEPEVASSAVARMVTAMAHRGPDGEGTYSARIGEAGLCLGHRRLAIRDLSEAGHQPMVHPETGDVLVYNGEIYGADELRRELAGLGSAFRGHSDAEVLLHALVRWGPAALGRLNGMYALGFFEQARTSLLLARDPMGMKPLYWVPEGSTLLFASEVRAVVRSGLVPPKISAAALGGLLAFGAPQEPLTILESVRTFPAGTWARFRLEPSGRAREEERARFWSIPAVDPTVSAEDAVPLVRSALDAAVRDHLVSDVPIGVFLSSGVDSTLIASLAARHTPHLRTFTVGFSTESPELSESPVAARTARRLGSTHNDVQLGPLDAEAAALAWLDLVDQPCVDGLNTYLIARAVRQAGITVALSGLGGDELFGGYSTFRDVARFRRVAPLTSAVPASWTRRAVNLVLRRSSRRVRDKLEEMLALPPDTLRIYLHRRRVISDRLLRELGHAPPLAGLDPSYLPLEAVGEAAPVGDDLVAAVSRCESVYYLRNTLLRDTDANGMASALEIRPPLLDRRVMDLAYRIPGDQRQPARRPPKHLLRRAFPDLIGPEVLSLRKRGFWLPIHRWMAGPLRPRCEASLDQLRTSGLVRSAGVDAIWQRFLAAPEPFGWAAPWVLVVVGSYLQTLRGGAASVGYGA